MKYLLRTTFVLWLTIVVAPVWADDVILVPDAIFDGRSSELITGKAVLVSNGRIVQIAALDSLEQSAAEIVQLPGQTLMPGLIELHSHVLLHPYDETNWNDQVLKESWAERALRAGNHLKASLEAGYTTLRDLGSEGAGYVDVGVKQALQKGVIVGPRLIVAGKAIVATGSYGRYTVAHASTPEAMRRAIMAGVETIEHGNAGTVEIFNLMKDRGVAWCPTLAAGEAIAGYQGWKKGEGAEPKRITAQKASFAAALQTGVIMCAGSDVGVFDHGDNAWELELMVEYGMKPVDVLRSATSINASLLHMADQIGQVKVGMLAELIAVKGNPITDISVLRKPTLVMQGEIVLNKN